MNLEFRKPPDILKPFVRRFIVSDYDVPTQLVFHPWATGHIYLIWYFGPLENYTITIDGILQPVTEPLWIAGQTEYHQVRVTICERTSAVVAELTPQAYWRLFRSPGRLLTGTTCLANAVAPVKQAYDTAPSSSEECLAAMTAFLESAAALALPADRMLEEALHIMESHHGRISVSDVAAAVRVSSRHLTRRFTEIVGLSPKFYARVMQINQVIEMMFLPGCGSIAEVAQDGGFYDQAHLNRAMQLFFSEGPSAFLKSDHRLFRTFLEQLDEQSA